LVLDGTFGVTPKTPSLNQVRLSMKSDRSSRCNHQERRAWAKL
jgi:hypothetical protein